ncbi:NERD domain-containing protein [Actinotalea sp. C106]|uniref:NERD domain-containing protein n=1 Tax=Actinotalea sp. C106 TaxID=2908644 RepID=UPI0020283669|nr:NERD domain-containing protein [Actinotalea sp. C106]
MSTGFDVEDGHLLTGAIDALKQHGWTALHDLQWPGQPLAIIDHVVLGPGGVVVVEHKRWTGLVTAQDGDLLQDGQSRHSAVERAAQAAAALTAPLSPKHRSAVSAVICLDGQDLSPTAVGLGVTTVGDAQLPGHLAGLAPVLSPFDVVDIARHFMRSLIATRTSVQATTADFVIPDSWPAQAPRQRRRRGILGFGA